MMTKKTMTIISVFMVVALTAVGFAAWLIVGTIDAETQGSFVANELQDKYFTVSVNFDNDGTVAEDRGDIIFGAPSSNTLTGEEWLTYKTDKVDESGKITEPGDKKEKLTATATIKFTPDAGFHNNKTVEYYLTDANGNARTIRVKIDILESLNNEGTTENPSYKETTNYQWFDWAVQLGYMKYPTIKIGDTTTFNTGSNTLDPTTGKYTVGSLAEGTPFSFQNGCYYFDLTAGNFTIDGSKNYATAEITITFEWGTAINNQNPYLYFAKIEKPGDKLVSVSNYLLKSEIDGEVSYSLERTTDSDSSTATLDDDTKIRNKDLAERLLSYLENYLSKIQYSIELSETPAAN